MEMEALLLVYSILLHKTDSRGPRKSIKSNNSTVQLNTAMQSLLHLKYILLFFITTKTCDISCCEAMRKDK